jgi:hypothetical protein
MGTSKGLNEWLALRKRLLEEERAYARDRLAMERGEQADVESLSIKQSEIRALRALSRAVVRRVFCKTPGSGPTFADSSAPSA